MLGVIISSQFSVVHHVVLVEGVPAKAGDYVLTFTGKEQIEKQWKDREKWRYNVSINREGQAPSQATSIAAVLYVSDYNRRQSPFLEPGIRWGIHNDLYITPKATSAEDLFRATTVMKGASIRLPFDTSVVLTLERFTMPMEEGQTPDGRMQMAAVLRTANGQLPTANGEIRALTMIGQGDQGPTFAPVWTQLPGSPYGVGLTRVIRNNQDPGKSSAELSFRDMTKPMPEPREVFIVDFSEKPWIALVWFGVITMVLGFAFSIGRYAKMVREPMASAGPTADDRTSAAGAQLPAEPQSTTADPS
jgi:hypothetical protein